MVSIHASITIVNGTLLDPSKYETIYKASRGDTCWFYFKFLILVDCISLLLFKELFGKLLIAALLGKLFAEVS